MDVYQLLESEAHHHKISPVGTGRLIAMVGTTDPDHQGSTNLQVLFGLVLTIYLAQPRIKTSYLRPVYTDSVTLKQ